MQTRTLGQQGLEVSALGLGCMGMSFAYGLPNDEESLRVLQRAREVGITFWDTAEIYGPYTNEALLGRALKEIPRHEVIIASKFGFRLGPNREQLGFDSRPAHVQEALDGTLKRLGTDYLDLYYQHRLDPATPIEETVGALVELVKAGKVRYIGLSEVGPATIRRAQRVFPLSAVQSEYSLWERGVETQVLPVLRELGIGFVAYSPIGRGFLSGKIRTPADLPEADWRRSVPRFQPVNFQENLRLVEIVTHIAARHAATPAQVALAWLLRQGQDIVPIPGTKHVAYLEENAAAASLALPNAAWSELDQALASFQPAGERYTEEGMRSIDKAA